MTAADHSAPLDGDAPATGDHGIVRRPHPKHRPIPWHPVSTSWPLGQFGRRLRTSPAAAPGVLVASELTVTKVSSGTVSPPWRAIRSGKMRGDYECSPGTVRAYANAPADAIRPSPASKVIPYCGPTGFRVTHLRCGRSGHAPTRAIFFVLCGGRSLALIRRSAASLAAIASSGSVAEFMFEQMMLRARSAAFAGRGPLVGSQHPGARGRPGPGRPGQR